MTHGQHRAPQDLSADPFGERSGPLMLRRYRVLGAQIQFESHSRQLLRLVDAAYAGLPRHRLAAVVPRLRVILLLLPHRGMPSKPSAPAMFSGAGLLVGTAASSGLVIVSPRERAALVAVPADLLQFPY